MVKRLLLTGCVGFVGTHTADYFKKKGWDVCGIDNLTDYELKRTGFDVENSRMHNITFLNNLGMEFRKLDCRYVTTDEILKEFGTVDFIIHCAAQPAMTIAIEDPYYDADDNILSVINMLNIAKKLRVPFINCSSIHVYGNDFNNTLTELKTRFTNNPEEINEDTPILKGEVTPLHISKIATEFYTSFFAKTYNIRMASFRLTGMYGERQFGGMDHGWVANFAIRTIMNRPITIFGTDKQVRDILYAEDVARAFEMWFWNGKTGIYNIGGGMKTSISLKECLDKLSIISHHKQDITLKPARQGDLWYFVCNYSKAEKEFGWKPTISTDEGIKRIVKWIEENKEIL